MFVGDLSLTAAVMSIASDLFRFCFFGFVFIRREFFSPFCTILPFIPDHRPVAVFTVTRLYSYGEVFFVISFPVLFLLLVTLSFYFFFFHSHRWCEKFWSDLVSSWKLGRREEKIFPTSGFAPTVTLFCVAHLEAAASVVCLCPFKPSEQQLPKINDRV